LSLARTPHASLALRLGGLAASVDLVTVGLSSEGFVAERKQFGRPSGIFIDGSDCIYVADSESERMRPARRGHRVREPSGAEGVGAGAFGNVYGAVVRRRLLEKFVPVGRIRP